jgi:hypothetical protein
MLGRESGQRGPALVILSRPRASCEAQRRLRSTASRRQSRTTSQNSCASRATNRASSNASLRDTFVARGLAFNEIDFAPFRARLTGVYATWKDKLGGKCRSLLEAQAGVALSPAAAQLVRRRLATQPRRAAGDHSE